MTCFCEPSELQHSYKHLLHLEKHRTVPRADAQLCHGPEEHVGPWHDAQALFRRILGKIRSMYVCVHDLLLNWQVLHSARAATPCEHFSRVYVDRINLRSTHKSIRVQEVLEISTKILCRPWGFEKKGEWSAPLRRNTRSGGSAFTMLSWSSRVMALSSEVST